MKETGTKTPFLIFIFLVLQTYRVPYIKGKTENKGQRERQKERQRQVVRNRYQLQTRETDRDTVRKSERERGEKKICKKGTNIGYSAGCQRSLGLFHVVIVTIQNGSTLLGHKGTAFYSTVQHVPSIPQILYMGFGFLLQPQCGMGQRTNYPTAVPTKD